MRRGVGWNGEALVVLAPTKNCHTYDSGHAS
jgi:hypothetical protein